jgi:hypothetical protein
MKVAVCYSGQIGALHKAHQFQRSSFLKNDMDVYAYTSDLISQKTNKTPNHNPSSEIHTYLPAGKGWRKNQGEYGIIYRIPYRTITKSMSLLNPNLVKAVVDKEDLEESLEDWNMTKWEWMRKRQLSKLYKCNELMKSHDEDYDIIVRTRFEFGPHVNIDIRAIFSNHADPHNTIFMFGGWNCVAPMIFMDEFVCDGFAFGSPRVMDIFCSLANKVNPYPYNPKYKDCWDKFGDNVEYQFKKHLDENNINIEYIGNKRSMYHLWR